MSEKRHVKFSPSPPAGRGILKHPESSPRDSGVGSSSSDHTGSSGSLDERFTPRDYDIQSNNVDALREALRDTIKDIDNWRTRYLKKNNEQLETRRNLKNSENRYREACEKTETMEAQMESMEDRMAKQDVALDIANDKIRELESNLDDQIAELSEWKDKYKQLHELYEVTKHSTDGSVVSAGSGELSQGLGRRRSQREKKESTDMTSRMKQRINRGDQADSGSSHGSKSSRSSEATVNSKRSSHHASTSSSDKLPYIEKMPRSNTSGLAASGLTSPREHGSYKLTTATSNTSSSRKHGVSSSSRSGYRENGDYIAHPLPDRSRYSG
ncbi:hypothetical protein F5B22DRAFT_559027 [Xylaria bambusicola]|uniref:uncharacterized protein n=1 Tax=Xylaria bambusicola TaxID=326684 RepID=UPI0020087A43|nr:uncharacterized protein F5B22DRAFT_559027 [Xylaria bambusicola]KAI0503247.1 hypothetical protein F5B22DRAFT_559027 [Xylaria bambusicola]